LSYNAVSVYFMGLPRIIDKTMKTPPSHKFKKTINK